VGGTLIACSFVFLDLKALDADENGTPDVAMAK